MPVAITYGYSRDHREDLKQWMLALTTTHEGDVPIFLRPLDGNSPDKEHLSAAAKEVMTKLREHLPDEHEQRIAVFDSGGYSEANMKSYNWKKGEENSAGVEKRLWHLSKQAFGCATDAQNAWAKALKGKPSWLLATFTLKEHQQRGRPKKEATPDQAA